MQSEHACSEIRFLEELSLNALPSLQTLVYDGWLLRFANGCTGRANSVQSLYPGAISLEEKIDHCEHIYASRGMPTLFKLTEASQPPILDEELERRGYWTRPRVSVQTKRIARTSSSPPDIRIEAAPSDDWLAAFFRIAHVREDRRETIAAMLRNILPATGYASGCVDDETVAVGLGVVERGWVGLFDINTAEEHRRQGHAGAVVQALCAWAVSRKAQNAYLQVVTENDPALALYESLGFRKSYTYWYREK
jgi:ribosomal protein S18 acetylase RimI-like enzyme